MDEEMSDSYTIGNKEAAVSIGGTGYSMSQATTGVMKMKGMMRPEGGIIRMFSTLHRLGIESDALRKTTMKLAAVMGLVYGFMMVMGALQALVKAKTAYLEMLAAAQTIAFALAQNWPAIAMAVIGTAAVYAGLKLGSGAWHFPSVNLKSRHDYQKQITTSLSQVPKAPAKKHGHPRHRRHGA
jgi:hypothetical protein